MAGKSDNKAMQEWVKEMADMCQPDSIYLCDGSEEEYQKLLQGMVDSGMATKLNQENRPGCYLLRRHPSDVARVANRTFIAPTTEEDAGPTNTWVEPPQLQAEMTQQ